VDLVQSEDYRGEFIQADVLDVTVEFVKGFDFVCASSPCEEFSVHGMKHFHPNPKFPDMGLVLFCWTRRLLDTAGVPYVMENVRSAQEFVGRSIHNCGPFHLWGKGVPVLVHQGISKGMNLGSTSILKSMSIEERRARRKQYPMLSSSSSSKQRQQLTAGVATIPPELAHCVADYAERIISAAEKEG